MILQEIVFIYQFFSILPVSIHREVCKIKSVRVCPFVVHKFRIRDFKYTSGMVARIAKDLSVSKRRILMEIFFESLFSYCPMLWIFCGRSLNTRLNALQKEPFDQHTIIIPLALEPYLTMISLLPFIRKMYVVQQLKCSR